ncbi:MAG: CDP-diacylglycerol--glycerol-3-phosphate 3-phosphatidyltransferase [Clostridia bacterium]|nr:CDP-diacylglycerol--glycerol-3-phosphate 3-phosphatidyltransferase [Clostridia bacterium]
MNTPNKLTILRVVLIPFFMLFAMYNIVPFSWLIALAIFIIAFFTDMLDGHLARKNNEVTDFGKIMDPLADKLLVTAALVCLTEKGIVSSWVTVIILAREFIVSGIRIAAAAEGKVIAASIWGKVKTIWQFIALSIALLIFKPVLIVDIVVWIAAVLTIISGADYIIKNAKHLSMK